MAFEKYTTAQLKRYQKNLILSSILGLAILCFLLGIGLYQTTHDKGTSIIFMVPVLCPLVILPGIFSGAIATELKKREKNVL